MPGLSNRRLSPTFVRRSSTAALAFYRSGTERQLAMTSLDSFGSRATLDVAGKSYTIYRLDALSKASNGNSDRLPFSLKILLENLLRNEDGAFVKRGEGPIRMRSLK